MTLKQEINAMIVQFLCGQYDPLRFSCDLEDKIFYNYDEIASLDAVFAKRLDDTFPEICAEYELGMDPEPFKEKIRRAYEKVFGETADF